MFGPMVALDLIAISTFENMKVLLQGNITRYPVYLFYLFICNQEPKMVFYCAKERSHIPQWDAYNMIM